MNYEIDYEKINNSNIIKKYTKAYDINDEIKEDKTNYIILYNGFMGEMIKNNNIEEIMVITNEIDYNLSDKVLVYKAFIDYLYYTKVKNLDFNDINEENRKKIEIIFTDSVSIWYIKNIPKTVNYIIIYNVNNIEDIKDDIYYRRNERDEDGERIEFDLSKDLYELLNINDTTEIINFKNYLENNK